MSIFRTYIDSSLTPGETQVLSEAACHHLGTVLRLPPGEHILLFNGDGNNYAAILESGPKKRQLLARITSCDPNPVESPLKVHLFQGISRQDRMETTIQKSVELGVASITPVLCKQARLQLDANRMVKKLSHWQKVVISACEQSGRSVVPTLHEPVPLMQWLAQPSNTARIMLQPASTDNIASLGSLQECSLLVGPESGFTQEEIIACQQAAVRPISLGPRILRTETAAPAALAILQALHGDL